MSIKIRTLDNIVGDNSNAVIEYFKLKSQLALTDEERYNALVRNDTRSYYVICRNNSRIFKFISECARYYNISVSTVIKAMQAGKPLRNGLIFEKLEGRS